MSLSSSLSSIGLLTLLSAAVPFAQARAVPAASATLAPQTTLPITFTKTVSANRAKPGDAVVARTTQVVRLSNGQEVRPGAEILGHVVRVQPFVFDKTPYARQAQSVLQIQFDTLLAQGEKIPLHVYVRAIADTFATNDAFEPRFNDADSPYSTTQVGGDIRTQSQSEIVSPEGDTVAYNKRGGNFAHLIANTGAGGARCDGSDTEQPVAIFSASACGAYGFPDIALSTGSDLNASQFSLSSNRRAPEVRRYSDALLEVLPGDVASNSAER
jgi:hypothetical protein